MHDADAEEPSWALDVEEVVSLVEGEACAPANSHMSQGCQDAQRP